VDNQDPGWLDLEHITRVYNSRGIDILDDGWSRDALVGS
jgi:hypothetical protein